MRTLSGGERTLIGGNFDVYVKVEVENQAGAFQDVSSINGRDFFLAASWKEDVDTPVSSGTVTLAREITGQQLPALFSASPINIVSGAYSPLIHGGQKIRISTASVVKGAAPVSGDYREVFLGRVDDPDWSATNNAMMLAVSDTGAFLNDTIIDTERDYGTDDGVSVESVMQQILNDNPIARLGGAVTLSVPTSPGWNIHKFTQSRVSLLEALRDLAQQIGWDVRYRYDSGGTSRLTFFSPDRAKTAVDATFGPSEYIDIPTFSENTDDIRTRIRVYYTDATTGDRLFQEFSVTSPLGYVRYMEVGEDATSNIDTAAEALAMATAMGLDLSTPQFSQQLDTTFFWPVQLGDLYTFTANGVHYDTDQTFAVASIQHDIDHDKHRTSLGVRGKPAGAYAAWLALGASSPEGPSSEETPDPRALALKNFRELRRTPTVVTYGWDALDADIAEIWAWGKLSPQDVDPPLSPTDDEDRLWRAIDTESPDLHLDDTTVTFDVAVPAFGNIQTWELQPVDASNTRGFPQRVKVLSVPDVPRITSIETTTGATGLFKQITALNVEDPQALGGTLKAWLNYASEADADPTTKPDGTITVTITPRTFGPTDAFIPASGIGTIELFDAVRIHAGKGKLVYFEFINTSGITSGLTTFTLLPGDSVINPDGTLANNSINLAAQVAASFTLPSVYTTLPPTGRVNEVAILVGPPPELYRWDSSAGAWIKSVQAPDITGVLTGPQLAAGIIDKTKIASSIAPPEILSSLPGSPGANRLALVGDTLYRSTSDGTAWTQAVPVTGLTGQITTAQIAVGAITNAVMAAGAVTNTVIADNSVSTPKLQAGSITTGTLAAGAVTTATIATGAITTSTLAAGAVTATQIAANAVTATQIAANAIVSGKIAAGAISATELAANSVTATQIAAGAVTSLSMTAGTISGTVIAAGTLNASAIIAGTITASQIGTNSIFAGAIIAGAVTATAIAAGAVDVTKLSTIVLSETAPNAGIIQIGKLRSIDGLRYLDLNASGSNPFLHHPAFDLFASGSANFGGVVSSSSFTTSLATFSGSANFTGTLKIFAGSVGDDVQGSIRFVDYSTVLQSRIWANYGGAPGASGLHVDTGSGCYFNDISSSGNANVQIAGQLTIVQGSSNAVVMLDSSARTLLQINTPPTGTPIDSTSMILLTRSGTTYTAKQVYQDAVNSGPSGYRQLLVAN